MARLDNTPGVRSIEPAVYNTVLLSSGGHARGLVLKGIDPELELRASEALRHIVAGPADLRRTRTGFRRSSWAGCWRTIWEFPRAITSR